MRQAQTTGVFDTSDTSDTSDKSDHMLTRHLPREELTRKAHYFGVGRRSPSLAIVRYPRGLTPYTRRKKRENA